MPYWSVIVIAYVMDRALGDPQWFPHPVRGIGWIITRLEHFLLSKNINKRVAGGILVGVVIFSVWGTVTLTIALLGSIHAICAYIGSIVFVYTALAAKDLGAHSMRIYHALVNNDLEAARKSVGMIVGRDTENLNRTEIIRATVETVAESMVDGIIAPIFYAFLGGAPLALTYKAVNTLDSMIGYKNERYREFGYFAAKIDDIANFIPARITAVLLPIVALLIGRNSVWCAKIIFRDRKNHPSPNSGIPEAGVAGALNIQLGGLNYYGGAPSEKPLIGDAVNQLCVQHIRQSLMIAHISSFLVLVIGVIVLNSI